MIFLPNRPIGGIACMHLIRRPGMSCISWVDQLYHGGHCSGTQAQPSQAPVIPSLYVFRRKILNDSAVMANGQGEGTECGYGYINGSQPVGPDPFGG